MQGVRTSAVSSQTGLTYSKDLSHSFIKLYKEKRHKKPVRSIFTFDKMKPQNPTALGSIAFFAMGLLVSSYISPTFAFAPFYNPSTLSRLSNDQLGVSLRMSTSTDTEEDSKQNMGPLEPDSSGIYNLQGEEDHL